MNFLILVTCIFYSMHLSSAKTFTRCELGRELMKHGFARSCLPDWVCLVEAESGRKTGCMGPVNTDGSRGCGIFQINNKKWCKHGSPGNKGGITCESVITDDIKIACDCAKKIHKEGGYEAWSGWKRNCKGKPLPHLSAECGI